MLLNLHATRAPTRPRANGTAPALADGAPRQRLWPRYRPLAWLALAFFAVATLTRLALLLATGEGIALFSFEALRAFVIGAGYDVVTFLYFAWPLVLLLCVLPRRWLTGWLGRASVFGLCALLLGVLAIVAVAEWTFWEEFQTRFNFIAVDYLVYTTEVIGNIRESYPVGWILAGLGGVVAVVLALSRRWLVVRDDATTWRQRGAVLGGWLLATVAVSFGVSADMKDHGSNQYGNELAGNGIYQFFGAFRTAALDYDRFYPKLPREEAYALVRKQLATADATFTSDDPTSITRAIHNAAPEQRLNVVLISVESLSADYLGRYGRTPSFTPLLDAFTDQTLYFDQLYASGTRTVRGLEALALSVPPTPGESIVKRPGNEHLHSLADVFNAKGYRSEFLYGGYGEFDNMNYFFGNNGYTVLDRSAILEESIHQANIWGVADEDLYTLTLGELDRAHADGTPLFAHVMTTSNHRPYTFPEGRIKGPQGLRGSAVAYTDWAIMDFIERARTKPWFDDTVFVITADHCAASGGIAQLPVFRYHIPMWIYAPKHVAPGIVDRMVAQIDIGPTILGLLGMDYTSEFYGVDVLQPQAPPERALIGNYQRLGYLRDGALVELSPQQRTDTVQPSYAFNVAQPPLPDNPERVREAVAYYQTASERFRTGAMTHAEVLPVSTSAGAR